MPRITRENHWSSEVCYHRLRRQYPFMRNWRLNIRIKGEKRREATECLTPGDSKRELQGNTRANRDCFSITTTILGNRLKTRRINPNERIRHGRASALTRALTHKERTIISLLYSDFRERAWLLNRSPLAASGARLSSLLLAAKINTVCQRVNSPCHKANQMSRPIRQGSAESRIY